MHFEAGDLAFFAISSLILHGSSRNLIRILLNDFWCHVWQKDYFNPSERMSEVANRQNWQIDQFHK